MTHYDRLNLAFQKYYDRLFNFEGLFLLLAGIAIGIFALDVGARQTFVFWSLLFGLGAVPFALNRFRKFPLRLSRNITPKVGAGSIVTYSITLENLGETPITDLHVRDEGLPWSIRPILQARLGQAVPPIQPGQKCKVQLQTRFQARGVFDLPALRAEYVDYLGLTRCGKTFTHPSRVTVYPQVYPVATIDLSRVRVHQPGGIPLAASVGESPEFRGLRAYRPGDPLRHISWKAFARLGKPIVREFQGEYFRRVAVVLDTHGKKHSYDDFEAAVSLVASISQFFEDNEYVIDLFAAGPKVYYLCTGRSLGHLNDVLELLACVQPCQDDTFPHVDDSLRTLLGHLSALVLVSTDWREDSRKFYREIAGEVPELKVLCVRSDETTLPLTDDVADGRMWRKLTPSDVREKVMEL